jgi:predicted peptidase
MEMRTETSHGLPVFARIGLCLLVLGLGWACANPSHPTGSPVERFGPFEVHSLTLAKSDGLPEAHRFLLLRPDPIDPEREYPLVLFLHGAGERGEGNWEALTRHFPKQMSSADSRARFECFLVIPQCRSGEVWGSYHWNEAPQFDAQTASPMMRVALEAVAQTIEQNRIDPTRLYATGLSMGGYGVWDLVAREPHRWAGAVPICGGGDPHTADRLKHTPLWVVHGGADQTVLPERSREMVAAVRAAGGQVQYSEYPGVGHPSWVRGYSDPDGPLPWLFQQQRVLQSTAPPNSAE